jgi:ABC-2 type transport system ATP-binding protein
MSSNKNSEEKPLALRIRGLKKVYDNKFTALKGIDLDIKQGDFFALLGPNGAGKSTTLGIVSSLVNKTEGEVSIFGFDLDKDPVQAKRSLGVVPQEFNFGVFEKVEHILLNQAGYYGIARKDAKVRAEKYLKQLDLWDKKDVQARMLSGGMKRRLMIARAMMHEPKMLILDEPTAGVDIEIRRSMWKFLQNMNANGTTIILTTHYLEEAESMCRNVAIINHGDIVINTSVKALLQQMDKTNFLVDVVETLTEVPAIEEFNLRFIDEHTLEFDLMKGQSINEVVKALDAKGLNLSGLRPKSNRMEEMFVEMMDQSKAAAEKTS